MDLSHIKQIRGEYPAEPANGDASQLTALIDRGYLKSLPSDPSKATTAVKIGNNPNF